MLSKNITFMTFPVVLVCDGKCEKAWGGNNRPKGYPEDSKHDDDWYWLADDEVGDAPVNPGTIEGTHIKPQRPEDRLNKWCARECERSRLIDPGCQLEIDDFSKRVYNCKFRDEINENDGSSSPGL